MGPDQTAKMNVLQQIIDMFTDKQLGGLKKKGQPDMVAVSVKADKPEDGMAATDGSDADDSDDDSEMLKKLMEAYGNKDDDNDPLAALK